MIFHLETYMEQVGDKSHGVGMAVLKLELKHGDVDFRDKVKKAILDCFIQKPETEEKQSAIGFVQGE